ncbi:MAG: AMP-dependent synthetase/ligase [Gemmataceae bacterium]|nr:AMP-dependent synthetase/ligase [Gemmataceae bacterium]
MEFRNLAELLRRQSERLGPRVALRYKKHGLYRDLTWSAYYEQTLSCASALVAAGVRPGDRVGLLAENRPEWLLADMGILAAGAVNVPPHAPLTAAQVQYQLADASVRWLFVSSAAQLDKIRQVRAQLPELRGVVAFDAQPTADDAQSWSGFVQRGRHQLAKNQQELQRREHRLGPDDLATVMYTSGTTGNPKGVMLTHGNLLSNALASDQASHRPPGAVLLNWLPLSHIYARTVDHYLQLAGGLVLCLADSAETLVQNLGEIQPTHLSSVPRFYEKVLTAVATLSPEDRRKRLKAIFGPRIDWLGSGGAPLPLQVAQAFAEAGLLILQGYGLTESAPVISFNRKESYKLDSVGQAIPGVEIRIGPDGEVLTRGPHVMRGYWNNSEASAEAVRDGWLHTGDLGRLDEQGFLFITGRKKELLVLSNGKKVVPTHIEGLLVGDPCIDQAVVHGEGKNFLSALIVPHWANVRKELPELADAEEKTLARHPAIQAFLEKRIAQAVKDVSPWEQVKKFIVLTEPFSVAAEELTVSLKLRRNVILSRHREALEALYRE